MVCDWIEGRRAVFGYCLGFHQVFPHGTVIGDKKKVYDNSECYEEYDEPNPHAVLSEAWASFADAELAGVSAMLGVVTRPGAYEAIGYSYHARVVFGVSLSDVLSEESCADGSWRGRLADVDLPARLPERIREFLGVFRERIGASTGVSSISDLSPPSLVIFV